VNVFAFVAAPMKWTPEPSREASTTFLDKLKSVALAAAFIGVLIIFAMGVSLWENVWRVSVDAPSTPPLAACRWPEPVASGSLTVPLTSGGPFDATADEERIARPRNGTQRNPEMALDPFTLVGIVGTALIILAYFATQQRWLTAEDWRYLLANLVGAILILLSLITAWNLPVAIIESFWAAISAYGLVRTAVATS
jgi:hypothetical protein